MCVIGLRAYRLVTAIDRQATAEISHEEVLPSIQCGEIIVRDEHFLLVDCRVLVGLYVATGRAPIGVQLTTIHECKCDSPRIVSWRKKEGDKIFTG